MLVSDAERERVVTRLGQEAIAGRLTVDELETRVAAALAARTRRDLARTQRGLPADRPLLGLAIRLTVLVATALWVLTVLVVLAVLAVTRYLVAQHRAADARHRRVVRG